MSLSIAAFLVQPGMSLKEAMAVINENALGTCFVVDSAGQLLGGLTDGDIRRALLGGKAMDSLVKEVMVGTFRSLPVTSSNAEIQAHLSEKIRVIPLVNENNVPVDFATRSKYHRIPVLEPNLEGNELAYVTDCIRSNWISSQGEYVKRFEADVRDYVGANYGLAVSNGTVALHLAIEALGIGAGDEVIVPSLTFAASANAVIHAGAIPVFVDVDEETWTIDPEEVKRLITPKTKAVMPVHLYGHPCRMDELVALCGDHGLRLIEDCAESLGSRYKGQHTGSFGDAACFSFFGNKTITTGEGGMVLFRNREVFELATVLRDHGMSKKERYWHDRVGFNYRLTNLQAAIGVAQMERVDSFVTKKRELSGRYEQSLGKLKGISFQKEASWARHSYWLSSARIGSAAPLSRDELLDKLQKNGIEARKVFYPLTDMPPYQKFLRAGQRFPVSEALAREGICFPSSVNLIDSDLNALFTTVERIFRSRE